MRFKLVSVLLLFLAEFSFGQIKTAKIFSDNMVLQREIAIPVWGTANPGEEIVVKLDRFEVKAKTNSEGRWMVNLPLLPAGGPYKMIIKGKTESIEFNNVLIGDVWFASGQSNMEHPMKGWEWIPHSAVDNYNEEIADANYPEIRLFSVPKYPYPVEQTDLPAGQWEKANPESVAGFSSTAWYFAKELHQKLKVPIGIINCSWGGTPIQTWMSRETLELFKDSVKLPVVPEKFDQQAWFETTTQSIDNNRTRRNMISYPKKGLSEEINKTDFDDSSWKSVNLLEGDNHFGNIVWWRKKVTVPESFVQQKLELSLGFLNRQSQVYLNGAELGYYQYPQPVKIEIPQELVLAGENILTIRLAQPWGESQVLGSEEQLYICNSDHSFYQNMAKNWHANDQLEPVIKVAESPHNNPAFLFNGMVAPIIPFGIKGFVWYQGGANVRQPFLYAKMFQQMIINWRKLWRQGDLPFLFVQNSNIEQSHDFDKKSDSFCLLREAQQKALSIKNTGMVVSIDIGDPYDVHPGNKKAFGHRLALQAFRKVYNMDVIADGPIYSSYSLQKDTVIIRFSNIADGLKIHKIYPLNGFIIAGEDGCFYPATACVKNNEVVVFSKEVKKPAIVGYAWEDNPACNLFNSAGLPAAPFLLRISGSKQSAQ